ncbi:MAG: glycosyltransferase family 2 protein [Acidimicrobiales bacterium]
MTDEPMTGREQPPSIDAGRGVAPDAAAVVISYNVCGLLLACIDSLRADGVEQIVVVDNASSDRSVEAVRAHDPLVEVIALDRNVGFAAAANRGVARTTTPFVAVLNPDLLLDAPVCKVLVETLERDTGLGLVGPLIRTPDGALYPSVRRFPDLVDAAGHAFLHFVWPMNPFSRRYRMLDWDHELPADVDWVAGTFMMARREAWEEIGGFDEGFFMYLEDVDLCRRMHDAAWRVGYEPGASVVHMIGCSTDQTPYRMIAIHHRSLWRYARKTTVGAKRLALPLVGVALAVRVVLAWFQRAARGRPHAAA